MRWFFSGSRKQEQADRDRRLAEAQSELSRIRERAERVAGPLERRLRRNYWGETAAAIARREH
jgi:hypothetical protein